ncbi:MAG: L-fucose/L-arabinose isomerase family protein [Aggregatilineales bacterium]
MQQLTLRIGFVPVARTTFDMALAEEVTQLAHQQLAAAGFHVVGPAEPLTTADAAQSLLSGFDDSLDAIVLLQATFADSSIALEVGRALLPVPLLLWAVPEEHTGGRLRLNSLCGVNLAAHALRRAGRRYYHIFATPGDAAVTRKLGALVRAAQARRMLRGTRVGRLGERPGGFETCDYDQDVLREHFGLEVVPIALGDVFDEARRADSAEVAAVRAKLAQQVAELDSVDRRATDGTLGVYWALKRLAARDNLQGVAVRCWPEFFTELGCAACGALSLLTDEQIPCSCEADVNGTITQIILQSLSGEPSFGTDLVSLDSERDALVLWHCGLAPLAMADPEVVPAATIHSNRRLPLLMQFPLKPGTVTVARLSAATRTLRLVVGRGEMLRAPMSFSGTSGVVRFERPAATILDTILSEGLEHHIALTYGDHIDALLALADLLNLPVLRL